jgi:LPS-assembly protein
MPHFLAAALFVTMVLAVPARASAQQPAPENTTADQQNRIGENHLTFTGRFEYERGDVKVYADAAELFRDQDRLLVTGNVVFRQGNNQISADRAEINTRTRLGTFYNASGFATAKPQRQTVSPGGVAPPPLIGQDTIVYFFGETVEKIAPRKYKIVSGGFTTCVQPTPRWDLHANTIVLNLDHYTLLRQVVMNVKGVPLFYLPILYYPTKREDRATGFLLPTYGTSTLRGHSLHNAFFWAINRSQDATILHDWYSKAGQGVGTEYRYNFGGGSDGNLRAHLLDEKAATGIAAARSYRLNGSANQLLPGRLRARARVDYFSSIATNQTFNTDINQASNGNRSVGGNVTGAWGNYSLSGTADRTEYFANQTQSNVAGSWPRISIARAERPVGDTPLYLSARGEYAHILNIGRTAETELDRSLTRVDFSPQIRFPFKKWQWFTANSAASLRNTYYSRSLDPLTLDPETEQPTIVGTDLNRRYIELQTQLTGPVFNRVWDTPDNGYAEKFKHSIEPFVNVTWQSVIDNVDRILDGTDRIVGGSTRYDYGIRNRFYAKQRSAVAGQAGQAREVVTVEVQQSYHTNERAAQVDPQYLTSEPGTQPNHFSPIVLTVRAQPTMELNASARAEFDSRYRELRYVTATGSYSWSTRVQTTLTWSKRAFIANLPEFSNPDRLDHSLNTSSTVRTLDNKYGATYTFNYDVLNATMRQQRITGFYNAQCCGVAFEFQNHRFGSGFAGIASDRRFFMSFTLAGLGNFSPFSGALGGIPR